MGGRNLKHMECSTFVPHISMNSGNRIIPLVASTLSGTKDFFGSSWFPWK